MKDDVLTPGGLDMTQRQQEPMGIKLTGVHIGDQEQALRFSTKEPGFVKLEAFEQSPLARRQT